MPETGTSKTNNGTKRCEKLPNGVPPQFDAIELHWAVRDGAWTHVLVPAKGIGINWPISDASGLKCQDIYGYTASWREIQAVYHFLAFFKSVIDFSLHE